MGQIKKAIYAGTFDPPTNGHLWLIEKTQELFDELIIAIGDNADKNSTTYSIEERAEMLSELTQGYPNTTVSIFEKQFLVDFANSIGASYIIRGIRSVSDYEYERSMRYINSDIHPEINTIFLFPPREYAEVSSTIVKGLVGNQNWESLIRLYVPELVAQHMIRKSSVSKKKKWFLI